jgi:hypothetical protein
MVCLILSRSEICATGMQNRFRHEVTHLVIELTDWCGSVRFCPDSRETELIASYLERRRDVVRELRLKGKDLNSAEQRKFSREC